MSGISPARWQQLSALFDQAVDASTQQRQVLIVRTAAQDPDLAAKLASMLKASQADGLLDENLNLRTQRADAVTRPSMLGDWVIEYELGRGGTGVVYAARRDAADTGQRAAIKHLHRRWDGSEQVQRFAHERRILARLSHPNIPKLIEHGLDSEGRPWLAQEFVDGIDVLRWAEQQQLTIAARVDLLRDVCAAVQHAHELFVVHRDLKPANLLVDANGHVHVLDFGVAKRTDGLEAGVTTLGALAGFTPEYAAPEQIAGGDVSAATDVYALGVLLYQLITGELPYQIDVQHLGKTAHAIAEQRPKPMEQAIRDLDVSTVQTRLQQRQTTLPSFKRAVRGDLWRIVQRALEKEPQRRYRSVVAMSVDLRRFLQNRPVSVTQSQWGYHARKFVQRNRWAVLLGNAAVLILLMGAASTWLQMQRTGREADMARRSQLAIAEVLRNVGQSGPDVDVASNLLHTGMQQLDTFPPDSVARRELADVLSEVLWLRGHWELAETLTVHELGARINGMGLRDAFDAHLLQRYALAQVKRGNTEPALLALRNALAHTSHLNPATSAKLSLELSQALMIADDPVSAAEAANRAYSQHVAAVDQAHVQNAYRLQQVATLTAARRGAEARAITEALLRAKQSRPESVDDILLLSMAGLRRSLFYDYADAEHLYAQAEPLSAKHVSIHNEFYNLSRAVNLMDLGQTDQSRVYLQRLFDHERYRHDMSESLSGGYDGRSEWYWLLGELALQQGDNAAASQAFAQAAQLLHAEVTHYGDNRSRQHQRTYALALHSIAVRSGNRSLADDVLAQAQASATLPGAQHTYAHAMTIAAQAHAQLPQQPAIAAALFAQAQRVLSDGRSKPLVLEFQLKEHRDALRYAVWEAQAWQAVGDLPRAEHAWAQAQALAQRTVGMQHPFAAALLGQ